jgi:DNA mismatch repair ATPase MutS
MEGWRTSIWVVPLVFQLGVLYALRGAIEPVLAPASSREAPFGRYVAIFRLIESTTFRAARLTHLHAEISGATRELARLQTILGYAELRSSGMVAVLANAFLLWDVFCAAALLAWRARSGASVRRWIEAMAELDALAALAAFAHEHPSWAFPEITKGELCFVAEGLGHPLIAPARRVDNDVSLRGPGSALMITGSNMSGKSTLLRAIGVNAVLALAGGPVCARRMSLAECQVRTSMRIADSLEEGVSHFYAELARLKAVVDAANAGERVLFLLDEVLHGTNSRERNIGAKAVVRHLLDKGAIGAVSSHDLGLATLADESAGRVTNVHFQELVAGGKMTFDYKLKPGVVTSSNALRLMKLIGIGVDLPEDPSAD